MAVGSERPRVLHLLNSRHFNGAEHVAANLMSGLSPGWESLYVSRPGPISDALASRSLAFRSVDGLSVRAVRKIVDEFRPDLVHAHDYRASLTAAALRRPTVSHLHNNYPWAKRLSPVTLAYRVASTRFARVIAVSRSVVEEHYFQSTLCKKSVVIGNGTDFERVRVRADEWAPANDVVFVGRMTEQKDPLAFVRIVKALQRPERPVRGIMLGSGELLEMCQRLIGELKLEDVLKAPGYVANPFPIMAASKLCLVPSLWEGFGLVAVEAQCLGAVALGRPVGGLIDILPPEQLCATEEDFVDTARALLDDEPRRRQVAEAGRRSVEERYALRDYVARVEQVYREVLGLPQPESGEPELAGTRG